MAESDLERFKRQQNLVADESLESTRRMVNMVEESQSAGDTLEDEIIMFDHHLSRYQEPRP